MHLIYALLPVSPSLNFCYVLYSGLFLCPLLTSFFKQLDKIPIDDIKTELRSAELSEQAVEELLQILTVKSLTELEGQSLRTDTEFY